MIEENGSQASRLKGEFENAVAHLVASLDWFHFPRQSFRISSTSSVL